MMERYRVKPGSKLRLKERDPNDRGSDGLDKTAGKQRLVQLSSELEALQERLYAEHKHKLLVILQGMDTSGKNSTIHHVFQYVDPLGVRVASFKAPTAEEQDRDYLWRVHRRVPARGEIVIFDRSHYEDVTIVRVHDLVPTKVWKRRFDQINDFERMLSEEGTTILKFFLHIDQDEQKRRLEARLQRRDKHWKFQPEDIRERRLWPEYIRAYQDVIRKTSTPWAPWYVVPANHKWYRNLVVGSVLVNTLRGLRMRYPRGAVDGDIVIP